MRSESHKVTLELLIELFDGFGFIRSCILKLPKVSYVDQEKLEETYFLTKIALVKMMKEGRVFNSEGDMFGYIFGVIRNNYNSVVRTSCLKKNAHVRVDLENAENKIGDYLVYDDTTNYLSIIERRLRFDESERRSPKGLNASDKVSIFFSKVVEGYTNKELSEMYNVSSNSISSAFTKVKEVINLK